MQVSKVLQPRGEGGGVLAPSLGTHCEPDPKAVAVKAETEER